MYFGGYAQTVPGCVPFGMSYAVHCQAAVHSPAKPQQNSPLQLQPHPCAFLLTSLVPSIPLLTGDFTSNFKGGKKSKETVLVSLFFKTLRMRRKGRCHFLKPIKGKAKSLSTHPRDVRSSSPSYIMPMICCNYLRHCG